MSKFIAELFKDEIKHGWRSYEKVAKDMGLASKQALSYFLNDKDDDNWSYNELRMFCATLEMNVDEVIAYADRRTRHSRCDDTVAGTDKKGICKPDWR